MMLIDGALRCRAHHGMEGSDRWATGVVMVLFLPSRAVHGSKKPFATADSSVKFGGGWMGQGLTFCFLVCVRVCHVFVQALPL